MSMNIIRRTYEHRIFFDYTMKSFALALLILITGSIGTHLTAEQMLVFAQEDFDVMYSIYDLSEGDGTGHLTDFHYGEKFYQYKYHPFGTLSGESAARCYFAVDFVLDGNSPQGSGHAVYKFPEDMVWSGMYENSTFYIVRSPSFNFPEDHNFEKLNPIKTRDNSMVIEFDLLEGLNTFIVNSTEFWDYQRSQKYDCPNPFNFEKQDYEYYDFVYPLKVQQNYAKKFGLVEEDFLCKSKLIPILKYDDSPACVTKSTKLKLVERGWADK